MVNIQWAEIVCIRKYSMLFQKFNSRDVTRLGIMKGAWVFCIFSLELMQVVDQRYGYKDLIVLLNVLVFEVDILGDIFKGFFGWLLESLVK